MGNSQSKLGFKQDVFALAGNNCPPPTHKWWSQFYTLPESADDVFTLFSQHDIRALTSPSSEARSPNPNLETLIYLCVARLQAVQKDVNSLAANENVLNEVLSCIRLLTRCLPYIYEADVLREWEHGFFWKPRRAQQIAVRQFVDGLNPVKKISNPDEEIDRPLGQVLIDMLVRYLFTHGLTLPNKYDDNGVPQLRTSWNSWNSGIGCKKSAGMTKDNQKNAAEVLSLLLVLCSQQMYNSPVSVPPSISALQYLTTERDRQIVLTILCSLLNTVLKYNPSSWLVNPVADDPRARLVQLSSEFLMVLIVYNNNNNGTDPKNEYCHQLGRIHKPEDLQFIHQGMITALQSMVSPTSGVASYVPGALRPTAWSPETLVLLWELLKDNKRFKAFIIATDRVHDVVIMVLCCAVEAMDDLTRHGVLRLCILLLHTLSQDEEFATRLNTPLTAAESLPARLRIPNFHGSYADFLILTLRTIIVTSNGTLESMYEPIFYIIHDIAPFVRKLQRATSIRMTSLFSALANTDYLCRSRDNPKNLILLLGAFSVILGNDPYSENPRFVEAILRNRKQFYALREFTVDGALTELDRQAQRRKDRASGDGGGGGAVRGDSLESLRSPVPLQSQGLRNVPEHDAFAIGEDEDDEDVTDNDGESEATTRVVAASASVADETTAPTRSMSEKARGKQPAQRQQHHRQTSSLSRTTSTNTSTASLPSLLTSPQASTPHQFIPTQAWLETWVPYLPLHTILEVCDGHQKQTGNKAPATDRDPASAPNLAGGVGGTNGSTQQPRADPLSLPSRSAGPRSSPFTRTSVSMAWYLSLIWGLIFAADVAVNKGIRGLWTGTAIKLFNVESREHAITLRSPKGAVDALGDSIAQRLGTLSFVARDSPPPVVMRDV